MSKIKQSSVEWYAEQIDNLDYNPLEKNGYVNAKNRLLEQAKAMQQEQTVGFALNYAFGNNKVDNDIIMNCRKLYNETFGGNDE